ncbi:uncharacterized protein LOC133473493 isoform X1 [Phyllopteryx taeniolatus]|uniref:uncharacterized protein LOC133473493 isoform X1 n=1 Tax=Phyllopteryx taeniolatus TaxID=161469 RepID=UPI002AD534CB|nr:uncharacterized protein LOC133473493 isoform X1 [Phyllopteryx taeniolatus]
MSVVLFVARGCWCGLFQLSLGLGVWVATHPCLNTWKNHTQPKGEKGDDHGGTPWGEGKGGNRPEVQSHSPQAQPGDQDDTPGVGATGITRGRRADPGSGSPRRATLTQPYPSSSTQQSSNWSSSITVWFGDATKKDKIRLRQTKCFKLFTLPELRQGHTKSSWTRHILVSIYSSFFPQVGTIKQCKLKPANITTASSLLPSTS